MSERKQNSRQPFPSVTIIGEGITEQHYFTHLKVIRKYKCIIKPRFFNNTCITEIGKRIEEVLQGNSIAICIFDADVSRREPKENIKLEKLKQKYKKNKNVILCESFPTIEYWFLIHFKDTCPHFTNSKEVERALLKHLKNYEKTESFLSNENWVKEMSFIKGDLMKACQRAKKYSDEIASYSKLYIAINKLDESLI